MSFLISETKKFHKPYLRIPPYMQPTHVPQKGDFRFVDISTLKMHQAHHLSVCHYYWVAAVIAVGADSAAALLLSGPKYSEQYWCLCACALLYNYTEGRVGHLFTSGTSGQGHDTV